LPSTKPSLDVSLGDRDDWQRRKRCGISMSETTTRAMPADLANNEIALPLIGTLGEGQLHRALKLLYAAPGDLLESRVGNHVVDVLKPGEAVEIQTGSFSRLARKLDALLPMIDVRLVFPACLKRWIVKYDAERDEVSRRKSPKECGFDEVFVHLVSIARHLSHPRLSLEVVGTLQEEVRVPTTRRRRSRWSTVERRLIGIEEMRIVRAPADLLILLDEPLPERFSARELAVALGRPLHLAQKIAYCLRHAGLYEIAGKDGNALIYSRSPA
jgi:hypothetical protein